MDRLAELLRRPRLVGILGPVIVGLGLVAAIALGRPFGGPARGPAGSASPATEVVVPGGWHPIAWSDDGSRLLVRRAAEFAVVSDDGAVTPSAATWAAWVPGAPSTLALVEPSGTGERLALRDDSGSRSLAELPVIDAVAVSADGARWALSDGAAILGGRLDGGDRQELLSEPATSLVWNPGREVLAARVLADPNEPDRGRVLLLDVAADGRSVVPLAYLAAEDGYAWSPRGDQLAFSGRIGDERGLYLVPADLSGPANKLADEVDGPSVRWSSDGAWLTAARLTSNGPTTELLIARVNETGARVSSAGPGRVTAWSPAGARLLTVDSGGNLVLIDVAEGARTVLATGVDGGCMPAWSGGTAGRIAYCDAAGGLHIRSAPPP